MKKVYEIKLNSDSFWEWQIVLSDKENKRLSIIDCLDNDLEIKIKENEFLRFFLINKQPNKSEREEIPLVTDILRWTNDITLGAFSPKNGVIISNKLKNILENYKLPNHFLYPLEIVNAETQEINKSYYLLQIIGNNRELTNYRESSYIYMPRRSRDILKTTIGEFKDFEEFSKIRKKNLFEDKINIKIHPTLETDFEILPSYFNTIYASEIFLKEKDYLKGVTFKHEESMTIKDNKEI